MLHLKKMIAFYIVALSFLVACTPARQGATEKGFIATGIANPIEIIVNSPLTLFGYGKQNGDIKAFDVTISPTVPMQFAVFSSPEDKEHKQYAHTFIATLPSDMWKFSIESWERPSSLEHSKRLVAGRNFTVQTFIITDKNDWFSQLWEKNAHTTSSAWIARRFSYSPKTNIRVVAEYREPVAECLKSYMHPETNQQEVKFSSSDRQIIWGNCSKELSAFTERSDAAFTIRRPTDIQVAKTTPPLLLPDTRPNISKLAGNVEFLLLSPR